MAQQNIILKRSSLPGKVPTTGSLDLGELALNTYEGKAFLKKSGSFEAIEELVTTNTLNSGSISISDTGSFGEIVIKNDLNVSGSSYIKGDIVGNNDLDVLGSITGSSLRINGSGSFESLQINDTMTVNHGYTLISGSQYITQDLTVFGAVNASQFNISIISSSVIFQSGSTKFGDTLDDIHQFTGSVEITGSFLVNGKEVGVANGPNTFDFNLDPSAAGTTNFIEDSTGNTQIVAKTNSIDVLFYQTASVSISATAFNVTTESVTTDYYQLYHLAKYITTSGDLDFNV